LSVLPDLYNGGTVFEEDIGWMAMGLTDEARWWGYRNKVGGNVMMWDN
jgi:hypothetical protein